MNPTNFSSRALISLALAVVACGSQGAESSPDDSQGALTHNADESAIDSKAVGFWVEQGVSGPAMFHAVRINADGTYRATGGCLDGVPARCHMIVSSSGKWTIKGSDAHQQIIFTDSEFEHTTYSFYYKVDGDSVLVSETVGGPTSKFAKRVAELAPGQACALPGAPGKCIEGYECRSDCPANARCLVQSQVCLPKLALQQGAACGNDTPGECGEGLACKDNCPPGQMCIARIKTCQPTISFNPQ